MTRLVAFVVLAGVCLAAARAQERTETVVVPTFGQVVVYSPSGPPQSVVLFVSGDGGWTSA